MIHIDLIRQLNEQLKLQDAKRRAYQEISTARKERLTHLKAESLKEDQMIECYIEPDGSIRVESFRVGSCQEVVIGYLRQGGEDEYYWHFYPSRACVLNAGMCRRLFQRLAELNKDVPNDN